MTGINVKAVYDERCGYTVYANNRGEGAEFQSEDTILECLSQEELEGLTIKEIIQCMEM